LDLRGIEIFLAICERGGLTAAAHSLGLTQAGVSQHLAKLERELGVTLMDRNVRPPRLTAAGEHLRRRGAALIEGLRTVQAELLRYRHFDIPRMRLGVIESAASAILPSLVRRLAGKAGSLSVTSGTTHPLMPELRSGGFDILISSETFDDDAALASACLLIEPIVLILPRGSRRPTTWEDVAELAKRLDFISYGERRRLGGRVQRILERRGVEVHGTMSFDSSYPLFDYVRSGSGWAATTPMCMMCSAVHPLDFEICSFPDVAPIRSINAIWRQQDSGMEIEQVVATIRTILREDVLPKLESLSDASFDRVQVIDGETRPTGKCAHEETRLSGAARQGEELA